MKNTLFLIGAACLLIGCVDQDFFVKNNVTYETYERQYVGCQTEATQKVPTNTQVTWAPYVGIYSVDTNSGLRAKNFEICMRDHGYVPVTLPYCTGDAATLANQESRQPQDRTKHMTITSETCYITTSTGKNHIYTP